MKVKKRKTKPVRCGCGGMMETVDSRLMDASDALEMGYLHVLDTKKCEICGKEKSFRRKAGDYED